MCGYEGEDKERLRTIFLELILEVTRLINGFRYCNNKNCSCSPESHIKRLLRHYGYEIGSLIGNQKLTDVSTISIKDFLNQFSDDEGEDLY